MAKFMSVGVVSVCLSAVIFHFSSEYFRHSIPTPQLRLFAANGIAFAITVTTAFLMNSRITFREHGAGLPEYVRYGIVNLVGFCLNTLLLIGFSQLIALVRRQTLNEMLDTFRLGKMMAWAGAVGCVFFWNFFMSRHWVFRKRSSEPVSVKTLVQVGSPATSDNQAPLEVG